jgi:hypothetical protein
MCEIHSETLLNNEYNLNKMKDKNVKIGPFWDWVPLRMGRVNRNSEGG